MLLCVFLLLLTAFVCHLIKGLLTYLLSYTQHITNVARLSCVTGCLLCMIVYICMSYMLVRLSGCLNHIKGTIIIIIIIILECEMQ